MELNFDLIKYATLIVLMLFSLQILHAEPTEKNNGKRDYVNNCAECHGAEGRGNGPTARELASTPTDLTLLSKENGGSFPETLVYNVIDGRRVSDFHGTEMPIWGEHFKETEGSEEAVEKRISNLIEYLISIQKK